MQALGAIVLFGVLCGASPQAKPDPGSEPQPAPLAWTFAQAVERGMAFELGSAISDVEIRRAVAQKRQVSGTARPTLTATGLYLHLDHTRELAGRVLSGENQVNGNVLLQVPVVAPRAWGNVSQAERAIGVARDRRRESRRQAGIGTAQAYLTALTMRHRAEELKRAVQTQAEHLRYAQMRREAGLGNTLDVLRAQQAVADSTVLWAQSRAMSQQAQETLGAMTGADGPVTPAEDITLSDVPAAQAALERMPWRRDDVRRAQSDVELARLVRHDSWLDYMPTLWAAGALLSTHPATPTAPKLGWQISLLLTLPLYDGGVREGQRDERRTTEQESLLALDTLLRRSRAELRQAYFGLDTAKEALSAAHQSRTSADAALSLASQAYRTGTTGNLEVIDAERVSLDAATQLVEAEDSLKRAQLELLSAAGVFPPPGLP